MKRCCVVVSMSLLSNRGLMEARVCDLPALLSTKPIRFSHGAHFAGMEYRWDTDALLLYFSHESLPEVEEGCMCEQAGLEEARERWPALFEDEGPFSNRYVDF